MTRFWTPGIGSAGALTGDERVTLDTGGALPKTTTTGAIAGLAGITSDNEAVTAITTVGDGSLTAAAIIGGVIARGGTQVAAFTDTTVTAAAIIAALPEGLDDGTSFKVRIENGTTFAETVAGGTGVTVSGNAIIPALTWADYLLTVTSVEDETITLVFIGGGQLSPLPVTALDTQAIPAAVTLQVGGLTGGQTSALVLTGDSGLANPSLALPPAAELIAAIPNARIGLSYTAVIRNAFTTTSIATVTGSATGVTLSGTATIANAGSAMFNITLTSLTAYTATRIGP